MTKKDIHNLILEKHQTLYDWLEKHPNENWTKGPADKWNTGQHIVHLIRSESALNKALGMPKFLLNYKFGTNNRDNRSYVEVVKKYQNKLAANPGLVADISKNMPAITAANKATLMAKLEAKNAKLLKKFQKWSDKDLDTYLLPHPLLGRMTIREIMMWNAYHTEHHYENLKANY